MNLRDYVVTLSGGLDLDVATEIIEVFATGDSMNPSRLGGGIYEPAVRSSQQLNLPRTAKTVGAPRMRFLVRQLQNAIHDWISAYRAHVSEDLLLTGFDDPQLIRYVTGNFFAPHFDVPSPQPRLVSAIALLPSEFEGGELRMYEHAERVDLSPGDVCLFPSNFLYPHSVSEVTSGCRHSIVSFIR